MACYQHLTAWRRKDGKVTFKQKEGYYDKPVKVACGQCIGCELEKARRWAVRCHHEAQMHKENSFVTLTYDTPHLPRNGSLDLADWQHFAKRLRKARGPFRFFHCGEYGEDTYRPHYHALLFGLDFSKSQHFYKKTRQGHNLYISPELDEIWGKGHCFIGSVTLESAGYVARYCVKKRTSEQTEPCPQVDPTTGELYEIKAPYATMSRRPGIGATWLEKYQGDIYPKDFVTVAGKKQRPPAYYDRLIEKKDPALLAEMKERRRKAGYRHRENNTWIRLRTRETIQQKKAEHLVRPDN